jgi:hypothetical protein
MREEVFAQSDGWQYAEAGISKLQLVKPLQFLLNVQKLKLPTSPGLRILRVGNWPYSIVSINCFAVIVGNFEFLKSFRFLVIITSCSSSIAVKY